MGRILVIGFGNPGRRDDGLGPAAAARIDSFGYDNVVVDTAYQLDVEDAARVGEFDQVLFVDATTAGEKPYCLETVDPSDAQPFTTHGLTPATLMGLARDVLGLDVPAWVLAIRGYEFDEFDESISSDALENLAAALTFVTPRLVDGDLGGTRAPALSLCPGASREVSP